MKFEKNSLYLCRAKDFVSIHANINNYSEG